MDTPKWFDMRELTYKDDFDLILKRQGWYDFSYQSIYNDPQVINHRLLINGKTYATFFKLFGDTTFRKILSFIFSGPRTKEELEQRYGGKKLDGYLDFLKEQEIAMYEDSFWRKAPQYAHVQDMSRTLEWYVAEWFRYELKAPARHGVHIEGIGDGGDLDDVAFVDGARIMVECKSGDPANITEAHLELYLRRAADFNPDVALLLIDTDQEINKQLEMLKKVYLKSDHIGPNSSKQWNIACVHVRNVKNSIDRSLRETLKTHSANHYNDRPLIGLPTNPDEVKKKTAQDHIAELHRRLELQQNRPSLEQTMATWFERVSSDDYRYIQEVFSGDSPIEAGHLSNCRQLIRQGNLRAEDDDGVTLGSFIWNPKQRYCSTM